MTRPPALYWDEKIVMSYLKHAAEIHRRLPEVKVQGYVCLWPESLKDDWERFYDAVNAKTTMGSPMPAEVTYQETVMLWLRETNKPNQQIIWSRSNKIPWKILTDEFGLCKATLWKRMNEGLGDIIVHLNKTDPSGNLSRRLQRSANGIDEHS